MSKDTFILDAQDLKPKKNDIIIMQEKIMNNYS